MDLTLAIILFLAAAAVGFVAGIWRASCTTGRSMLSILRGHPGEERQQVQRGDPGEER